MPGKKIGDLNAYGSINTDTSRRSRLEIDRNSGTYSSPIYGPDDSCKITLEELKEALNIKEYLVNEVIGKTNGDTLEVDKINVLNLTSNATFTLPTASIAYKGKALIIIQSNVNNYKAVINGAAQGPINISDFRDAIIFNCVFDGTSSYDWFAISKDDSKICNRLVVVSSSTYTANANDNIQANAQSLGSDIDITIPTAGIEGRLIYAYYPTGSPSAFVVELIGGFTATLNQGDYFLIRDNGSYWEAISTSQNTATTPNLDTVTGEGSTTTNSIEVGGLVVDMPSGSGVATSITKGGEGEALTVNKTSGSGNVASFNNGTTLVKDLEVSTATASTPTFFSSAKKIISATGALLGTWFQTLTAKSTPLVDADTIILNDSASSFEAKITTLTELWTNYIKSKADSVYLLLTGGTLTGALNEAPSVTLASSATTDIGNANSNNIIISGTTTITSFGTVAEGVVRMIRFSGALTLTHNATSLLLPNGTSITTQNGDTAIFRSLGSGNWICISYKSVTALTANIIPKINNSGFLVNSLIQDNGTTVSITNNTYLDKPSFGWSDLSTSLPTLTGSNARFTVLRSNSSVNCALYSNLGAGQYLFLNSQIGTKISRQFASGVNITFPCGTVIGGGVTPIYTSIANVGSCYHLYVTPETSPNSDYMELYFFVNGSNVVTSLVKVKPSNNTSIFDINLVANKLLTSGSASCNCTFNAEIGMRFDSATNIAQTMWRYSSDLTSIAIGGNTPNTSAQLDLQATNKGFLPNRMTNAQRTAISSPAIGLMVYCTDATEGLYIYKSTGWTFII